MTEVIRADGPACMMCAAKEGLFCVPWKLGPCNKNGRHGRHTLGRNHKAGTAMRPQFCPHPESKVPTTVNTQVALRQILHK